MPDLVRVKSPGDVLKSRHLAEEADALEDPGQTEVGGPVRLQPQQRMQISDTRSSRAPVHAKLSGTSLLRICRK